MNRESRRMDAVGSIVPIDSLWTVVAIDSL